MKSGIPASCLHEFPKAQLPSSDPRKIRFVEAANILLNSRRFSSGFEWNLSLSKIDNRLESCCKLGLGER